MRRQAPSCGGSITGLGTRCRVLSALVLPVILSPSSLLCKSRCLVFLSSMYVSSVVPVIAGGSSELCVHSCEAKPWVWRQMPDSFRPTCVECGVEKGAQECPLFTVLGPWSSALVFSVKKDEGERMCERKRREGGKEKGKKKEKRVYGIFFPAENKRDSETVYWTQVYNIYAATVGPPTFLLSSQNICLHFNTGNCMNYS